MVKITYLVIMASESPLVTEHTVRDLIDEQDRLRREYVRIEGALSEVTRKIEAVRTLIGDDRLRQITGDVKAAPRQSTMHPSGVEVTWTDWVLDALKRHPNGVSSIKLINEAREDPAVGQRVRATPNGYYNALSRMEKRGEIARVNGLYILMPEDAV